MFTLFTGSLGSVHDLSVGSSNLSIFVVWEAPFTLNVTDTEPDITYCVHIFNDSSGHEILLTCDIFDTEFHYTFLSEAICYDHKLRITVTPVNGAGHGPSKTVVYHCKLMLSSYNIYNHTTL